MNNQIVSTKLGTIVIMIFTITAGMFIWIVEKNQQAANLPPALVSAKKPTVAQAPAVNQQEQLTTPSQPTTATAQKQNDNVVHKPAMPTAADETGKSPEEIVKDFYDWYIASTNYNYYHIYKLNENKYPINIKGLILQSPFISSAYEQNMNKTSGGDPILCNQDNINNVFRGYEDKIISGDSAKMYALIGLSASSEENYKIQVMLRKEKKQWKIDEINCSQFRL